MREHPSVMYSGPKSTRPWRASSIAAICLAWLVLQVGGLFAPGLLDDVDSIYIQIAREMLQRHDFVTPTIDGIRFFDKPPLMYWLAAGSMRLFGIHDWAARIPLAVGMLALLFAVYALGNRMFRNLAPTQSPDRAGLYAALIMATAIGPYLYTRFYIPDIFIALWMTLAVHLFLSALDRLTTSATTPGAPSSRPLLGAKVGIEQSSTALPHAATGPGAPSFRGFIRKGGVSSESRPPSPLIPMLLFGAILALSLLTKGLIGIVFPVLFAVLYLAITHQLPLLRKLHLPAATTAFLAVAAPWHILAALRNPAIPMPAGLGLPARAGWAWFYLYNEHVARFLSKRIPHDYGQTPVWLFWLLAVLWMMPWATFLPSSVNQLLPGKLPARERQAATVLFVWAAVVMVFFTLSARQEYYSIPALPALALFIAAVLAAADRHPSSPPANRLEEFAASAHSSVLRASLYFLVPLTTLIALICAYFAIAAPHPATGVDLNEVLSSNPEMYNLSLGHIFDLSSAAMAFFRGPLAAVAVSMLALGLGSHLLRRRGATLAANLTIAAAMCGVLSAAHEGLVRFNPILGSKDLALSMEHIRQPGDLILLDGELTSGSTLLFYTGQPVHLVNGRVNGPWFGSFYPEAPSIFENDSTLRQRWSGPTRIFLLTYNPVQRTNDLSPQGAVITIASSGGKTVLSNRK